MEEVCRDYSSFLASCWKGTEQGRVGQMVENLYWDDPHCHSPTYSHYEFILLLRFKIRLWIKLPSQSILYRSFPLAPSLTYPHSVLGRPLLVGLLLEQRPLLSHQSLVPDSSVLFFLLQIRSESGLFPGKIGNSFLNRKKGPIPNPLMRRMQRERSLLRLWLPRRVRSPSSSPEPAGLLAGEGILS